MNPIGLYDIGKERMREKQEQADALRLSDQANRRSKRGSNFSYKVFLGFGMVIILVGLALFLAG